MSTVSVHLLPQLFKPVDLTGGVAVVIDVLRASTTIIHALAAGARGVIPTSEIDAARSVAAQIPRDQVLLGGERHGTRIEGFDLDNSPWNYSAEVVGDKTLAFTTTNGTRALESCRLADRVLIGAFVNRRGIVDWLSQSDQPVHMVCAGTDGQISAEDVLFAGAVADAVLKQRGNQVGPDDETQLAISLWRTAQDDPARIRQILRDSRGGRNLLELGFDRDIDRSATCDLFDIVPVFDMEQGLILMPEGSMSNDEARMSNQ